MAELQLTNGLDTSLKFYAVRDNIAYVRLTSVAGHKSFMLANRLERYSAQFPLPIAYLAAGLAIGFLFPLAYSWAPAAHIAIAMLSLIKVLGYCPTCPRPLFLDIDVGVWGAVLFIPLAWVACVRSTYRSVVVQAIAVGLVLTWQMISWYQYYQKCLPCSAIGFVGALLLASLCRLRGDEPVFRRLALYKMGLVSLVAGLAGFYYVNSMDARRVERPVSLAAFGISKQIPLRNVSQLGLWATGKPRVLLIAASGCKPCHDLLAYLSGHPTTIEYFSVDASLPDSTHKWNVLEDSSEVTRTPTLVRVAPDGSITQVLVGFSTDSNWLRGIDEFVRK